jgi:hypothetical protein
MTGAFPGGSSKIRAPCRNRARQTSSPVYRFGRLILVQTAQEVQCRKQPYPAHFTGRWTAVNPFAPCGFQPRAYNGPGAWRTHPFGGPIDGRFALGRGRRSLAGAGRKELGFRRAAVHSYTPRREHGGAGVEPDSGATPDDGTGTAVNCCGTEESLLLIETNGGKRVGRSGFAFLSGAGMAAGNRAHAI